MNRDDLNRITNGMETEKTTQNAHNTLHRSTKWNLEWTLIIHHHTTNTTTITGTETRNTPTTPIALKMTTNELVQIANGIDREKTTKNNN